MENHSRNSIFFSSRKNTSINVSGEENGSTAPSIPEEEDNRTPATPEEEGNTTRGVQQQEGSGTQRDPQEEAETVS